MVIKKKERTFLFFLAISLLIFSSFLSWGIAASVDDVYDGFEDKVEGVEDIITKEDARNEYIRNAWIERINKTTVGKGLFATNNYLLANSNFFYFFLGVEYSFSWKFFLVFTLFLVFAVFLFRISKGMWALLVVFYIKIKKDVFKKRGLSFNKTLKKLSRGNNAIADFFIFLFFILGIVLVKLPFFFGNMAGEFFSPDSSFISKVLYFSGIIVVIYFLIISSGLIRNKLKVFLESVCKREEEAGIEEEIEDIESGAKGKKFNKSRGSPVANDDEEAQEPEGSVNKKESEEEEKIKKEAEIEAEEDIRSISEDI